MDRKSQNNSPIETLFPALSEDESKQVQTVLEDYSELVYRIFLRVQNEREDDFDAEAMDP